MVNGLCWSALIQLKGPIEKNSLKVFLNKSTTGKVNWGLHFIGAGINPWTELVMNNVLKDLLFKTLVDWVPIYQFKTPIN